MVCGPGQLISCCIRATALRRWKAACQHGPQPARALEALRSRVCWGEASKCEPASCCEPAAMSCWQIAEWLVGGYAPGRSVAASAHATRGALSSQHSRAAESRVGVLRPNHSSPGAAAVDSSSLTAEMTIVYYITHQGCEERSRQLEKLAMFATKSENASPRDTGVTRSRVPGAMRMCEGGHQDTQKGHVWQVNHSCILLQGAMDSLKRGSEGHAARL